MPINRSIERMITKIVSSDRWNLLKIDGYSLMYIDTIYLIHIDRLIDAKRLVEIWVA